MFAINPKDYGITPNTLADLGNEFNKMLNSCKDIDGEKLIILEKGTYNITCDSAINQSFYISNTVGENEFKKGEDTTPYHNIALMISDIKDLTIDGSDSLIMMSGFMTNMVINACANIKIKNLAIDHIRPTASEIEIVTVKKFSCEFIIHKDSDYVVENNKLLFLHKNYTHIANNNAMTAWYNVVRQPNEPTIINRVMHPLRGTFRFKDLGGRKVKAYFYIPPILKIGQKYVLHFNKRSEVGIFIDLSDNIRFENVKMHFNHSLGYIGQRSSNLYFDKLTSAPREETGRITASTADFMHFCMCSGQISVTNSYFRGAFDDIINVHGIHFSVVKIEQNKIEVKFCHPQAYGFNPIAKDDHIDFVDCNSLLKIESNQVVNSRMIDKYTIELELKNNPSSSVNVGCAIEDTDKCASLYFANNFATDITTRGMLVTTRGKVVIENNTLQDMQMSGILISDDAKNWYESGRAMDVLIKNNKLIRCKDNAILILPENTVHKGYVHSNITIVDNTIELAKSANAIKAKSTNNLTIENNLVNGEVTMAHNVIKNCEFSKK